MVHMTSREFAEFIRSRCTAQKVTVGPLVAAGSAYTFDVSDAVSGRSAEVTVLVRGRSE